MILVCFGVFSPFSSIFPELLDVSIYGGVSELVFKGGVLCLYRKRYVWPYLRGGVYSIGRKRNETLNEAGINCLIVGCCSN